MRINQRLVPKTWAYGRLQGPIWTMRASSHHQITIFDPPHEGWATEFRVQQILPERIEEVPGTVLEPFECSGDRQIQPVTSPDDREQTSNGRPYLE
jgi:hypothetical protein